MGEEPEEDRGAQPGALYGRAFLPPGHEPLRGHGKAADQTHRLVSHLETRTRVLFKGLETGQSLLDGADTKIHTNIDAKSNLKTASLGRS